MFMVGPINGIFKGRDQFVALAHYGAPAMVEMQVRKEYIGDVIAGEAMLCEALFYTVIAMRVVVAEELFILLVAHAVVHEYFVVAMLYKQAAHGPAAHIVFIGYIGLVPHRFWHHAMHGTPVELKISGIYCV